MRYAYPSYILYKATKMTEYRRLFIPGGSYFFTVVTYQRRPIFNESCHIDLLREAFKHVMESKPFTIDAIVILPDHLHCLWQLPENDDRFFRALAGNSKIRFQAYWCRWQTPQGKGRLATPFLGTCHQGRRSIGGGISIIFITTPSSMAWPRPQRNGRIRHSARR